MKFSSLIPAVWLVLLALSGGTGCGGETERDLIFERIRTMARAAEAGDLEGVMTGVSLEYYDNRGRGFDQLEKLIANYLTGYQGIVIHVLDGEIDEILLPAASLHVDISVSSGLAKALRKVLSFTGYLVRISLKMQKDPGIWQVIAADWEIVSRDELFPGSQKILEKLFPSR